MLFRKLKEYLYRKRVTRKALDFAKEHTYASSTLSFFINEERANIKNITNILFEDARKELFTVFPDAKPIAARLVPVNHNVICIRCFSTDSEGYFLHGVRIYVKHHSKWKTYNYSSDFFDSCKSFSADDFTVTMCGSCGDVNTFRHMQKLQDYYFVY